MASKGDIIKEEIQPQIPKTWCRIPFKDGLEKTEKFVKLKSKEYLEEGEFPVVDQGEKFIAGYVIDDKLIYPGELPIVIFGDHTRNIKYIDFPFAVGADGTKILRPFKAVDSKFFYYYLRVLKIPAFGYSRHFKVFEYLDLPIPPLSEQKRIAAKLDELCGHIDALKTKLDRIPELLKNFRQQVLTQAVTGKLTEEWRKGKDLGEWEDQALADFSESRLGKMLDKAKNTGVPTEYLRNINVRWFHFDLMDLSKIKVEAEEIYKYNLEPGDVLICEGGEPGRAAIWKNEKEGIIFQKALHRVRLKKHVLPDYLLYNLFLDAKSERLNELFTGTTIKHLTGRNLSKYTIQVPPFQEQQEIVKRVEGLFAVADKIEAQYKSLKTKIDTLPQAILNKAFKGELVPQNPNDEPASVLLERVKRTKIKKQKS